MVYGSTNALASNAISTQFLKRLSLNLQNEQLIIAIELTLDMKRIELFEFEDFAWFPNWMRICLTRLIVVMHKLLNSSDDLVPLIKRALKYSENKTIIDLCSGSGGPMIEVFKTLTLEKGTINVELILTDLYPDMEIASEINDSLIQNLSYKTSPVNASNVNPDLKGIRTMIGSFHHMKPVTARKILENARENNAPICIYEISDNRFPTFLWWTTIPIIFLMALILTPFVRPLTWKQLIFTYLIPIIPLTFAWDGAVSNVRTYTLKDLDILLEGLESDDYQWEKGQITKKVNKLYLLGIPRLLNS